MTTSHINSHRLGPINGDSGIVRVGRDLRQAAAARLVSARIGGSMEAADRFLTYSEQNGIPLDYMWAKIVDGSVVRATALAVPHPGRTAMVFASRTNGSKPCQDTIEVLRHACVELSDIDVRIAQALLEPRELAERDAFVTAGFNVLATLSYLERSNENRIRKSGKPWPHDVTLETFSDSNSGGFEEALSASYEDTLDCPGLSGLRETSDVLAGHMATGQFNPELWTLITIDNRPAGVLMLNPSSRQKTIELVYLGLAKWARGRGLGAMLLQRGLEQCAQREERAITLAVDESNAPAIRVYFKAGFKRLLRRVALIRVLD